MTHVIMKLLVKFVFTASIKMIPGQNIEVASVIELSEASGRVAAGLFMTDG